MSEKVSRVITDFSFYTQTIWGLYSDNTCGWTVVCYLKRLHLGRMKSKVALIFFLFPIIVFSGVREVLVC